MKLFLNFLTLCLAGKAAAYSFTACNGEFDLYGGGYFVWAPTDSVYDDNYKPNLDCRYHFQLKAGTAVQIEMEGYSIKGDPANNCEGGDYLQFNVGDKKSKRICGEGNDYYLYQIGPLDKDVTVEGVFHPLCFF